jgi:hypothetical protein
VQAVDAEGKTPMTDHVPSRQSGLSARPASGRLPEPLPCPLHLNLGCGRDVRDGFVNIDLYSDDPRVVAMDVRRLANMTVEARRVP